MLNYYNPYDPRNLYSNYPNPTNPNFNIPQQNVPTVNGYAGANDYPLGPNSSILLLDESGNPLWCVTTDSACHKTVVPYDIYPRKSQEKKEEEDKIANLTKVITELSNNFDERLKLLEGKIDANTGNTKTAKPGVRWSSDESDSGSTSE